MRDHLVFYLNGRRHAVSGPAAGLTLSEYLRCGEKLVGTKLACSEGDCGACTVLVGEPDTDETRFAYRTIDSCIAFVYQLDRRHIVTVEGVADPPVRPGAPPTLSTVQQAMVDCHGSQCGFCTPGFVMAIHGLIEAEGADGPIDEETARIGLSGNLCRCTGYAQILDAVSRCTPANTTSIAERYDAAPMLADFARLGDEPVHVNASVAVSNAAMQSNGAASSNGWVGNGHAPAKRPVEVHVPTDLANLLELRAARPAAKLVSGATDVGVQHNHGRIAPAEVIFTGRVPELCELAIDEGVLRTGAAVSWTRVEDAVRDRLPEYHAILERFGSPQVRNAGTLVGNFANASPIADSLPLHYVAGSTIELASQRGERSVPIADFYRGYKELDLAGDELIVAVRTPLPTESTRLKLYKVSNRRDMDISTVTLGVWLEVDADDAISAARLAVGGCGPTVVRLPEAESRLVGATLSLDALEAAGRLAREAVTPITDVRGGAEYRSQLVENLFAKCWHDLTAPEAVTA